MELTKTVTKTLKVANLHPNEGQMESIGVHANPRIISEGDYRLLVESMRAKNMTGVLPLKVFNFNGEWVVLGGNMRLRAMQELHIDEVSCIVVPEDADAETLNEIIIKDNSTLGDWDMDALSNWDEPLSDWGVDVPEIKTDEDTTHEKSDNFNYESQYGVIVMCKTDAEQEDVYNRLTQEGYSCKVVSV